MILSIIPLTVAAEPVTLQNFFKDADGNALTPHIAESAAGDNATAWQIVDGKGLTFNSSNIYDGHASSIIFQEKSNANKIEATFKRDAKQGSKQLDNCGILFGLTDTTDSYNFFLPASAYGLFIDGYNNLFFARVGTGLGYKTHEHHLDDRIVGGAEAKVSLNDVITEGVTITAEWDESYNLKAYVNGKLVLEVQDTAQTKPDLSSAGDNLCGIYMSMTSTSKMYVKSLVAGKPANTKFNFSATLGLPEKVEHGTDTTFNGVVSINGWDNKGKFKLIDLVVDVPAGLKVIKVTSGSRLAGGKLSYNLDSKGKLRIVYFDANSNKDITINGNNFPAELFNITFGIKDAEIGTTFKIEVDHMSIILNSDSTDTDSARQVQTATAKGSVTVVRGITFSAAELYIGDGEDPILANKKAVLVTVTGITSIKKLIYNDQTNTFEFRCSPEISQKMGVVSYVALVDASVPIDDFSVSANYTFGEEDASDILFGNLNGDEVLNAQDTLIAVNLFLGKGGTPTDEIILTANVNGDGKIDENDALGIVDAFIYNDSEYEVVNKAMTVFN